MNLTFNGVDRNNNNAVIIESEMIAENFLTEFEEMYRGLFGAVSPENTPNHFVALSGAEIEIYFAPEDGVEQEILSEIHQYQDASDKLLIHVTCGKQEVIEMLASLHAVDYILVHENVAPLIDEVPPENL